MTQQPTERVPEFTLPWRLRIALETAGVSVGAYAEYLGVHRKTVSNWLSGRIEPRRVYLLQTALLTGVSSEWLETGREPEELVARALEEIETEEVERAGTVAGARSDNPAVTNQYPIGNAA